MTAEIRWDENAGLREDAVGSQVIDALEAQEIKEAVRGLPRARRAWCRDSASGIAG